jgi:TPR repeat protein
VVKFSCRIVTIAILAVELVAQATNPASLSAPQQQSSSQTLSSSEISELQTKAAAGDIASQRRLGFAYRDGNGVPQNDVSAVKWLRKAADQDDATAENDLGIMYGFGKGVERNKDEAFHLYLRAAKYGYAKAMFNVGASYYNGEGVATDDAAAFAWFLLAREAGDSSAEDAVRRSEAEKKATDGEACRRIGQMYQAGDELPKDLTQALRWYRRAGDSGDAEANVRVAGILLSQGRSKTQDEYEEARTRCEKASEQYSQGAYCVALIYKRGLGVAADPVQTVKWLSRAVDLGDARPTLDLANAFWKGDGVRPNLVTAYMWVWIASNSKVPGSEVQEEAIRKQMTAKEITRAKQKAFEWLQKQHHSFGLHRRTVQESTDPN